MAFYARMIGFAVRNPAVIPDLLSAAWAFRARAWYRTFPFLPLPPKDYVRWRMETAFGDPAATPPPQELARFLRWSRRMRRGL